MIRLVDPLMTQDSAARPLKAPPPSAKLCLDPEALAYDLVSQLPEGLGLWRRGTTYALTYALPEGGCILLAGLDADEARARVGRFLGRDPGPLSDWRPGP